jgi:hypothetical protein
VLELILFLLFLLVTAKKWYPLLACATDFGEFLWVFVGGFVFLDDFGEIAVWGQHLCIVLNKLFLRELVLAQL